MKTLFIINPVSGRRKRPDRVFKRIRRHCQEAGIEYYIRIWKFKEEIDEIIEAAKEEGYEKVVAVGGDGTVRAIGRRLVGTDIALGIIPAGSGNGYAGHIGYSRKHDTAIQQVINGRITSVDTGVFGGVPFLNVSGIGVQAEVAEKFAQSKTRGLQTYVQLGSQTFFQYKPYPAWLKVDDNEPIYYKEILTLEITNGTTWGRGAKISPGATLTDGYLVAVILEKLPVGKVVKILNQLFRGTLHRNKNVSLIKGKRFEIQRKEAGPAQVDGDPEWLGEKIVVEVRENSLNLVVPPGKWGL